MKLSTTSSIPGEDVHATLGIVHGTAVMTTDAVNDMVASVKNFFGGKVSKYERVFDEARNRALQAMIEQAREMGANAVIGVSIDVEINPMQKGTLLAAAATGTAVLSNKKSASGPLPI